MKRKGIPSLCLVILIVLSCLATSNTSELDINCLKSIKETLKGPSSTFSTWNFNDNSKGFTCRFAGVQCWDVNENRVMTIGLVNRGLRGPFPIGIRNCTSLLELNLSGNYLTGRIPSNIGDILRFITHLDLSTNNLSGPIPPSIANISFIRYLFLDNNQLTGQIPLQLGGFNRIESFSVANNRLSGQVPTFLFTNFSSKSYANNLGLCGGPLNACKNEDHKENEDHEDLFFSGFAVGFPLFTVLTILLMF